MNSADKAKDYFVKACQGRLKVQEEHITKWWERIASHYGEKQRYYHTMSHILDMLRHLELFCPAAVGDSAAVLLAVVFHEYLLTIIMFFNVLLLGLANNNCTVGSIKETNSQHSRPKLGFLARFAPICIH